MVSAASHSSKNKISAFSVREGAERVNILLIFNLAE
jgi:hypothetical protein